MLLNDGENQHLVTSRNRAESGHFEQAVELCDRLYDMKAEKHLIETAALIRARALEKDKHVFSLSDRRLPGKDTDYERGFAVETY